MKRADFEEKIAGSSGRERGSLLLQYSSYLLQIDAREALQKAEEALTLSREIANNDFMLYCKIHRSYALLYLGELKELLEYCTSLSESAEECDSDLGRGTYYLLRGDVFNRQGKAEDAISNYLEALKIFRRSDMKGKMMSCYNNLAMVHHKLQEMTEAYKYLELALEIGEEIEHPECDTIRMNMGSIQYADDNFEKALELYMATAESYRKKDKKRNEAYATFNIGLAYGALNDREEETRYFQKSYEILKEKENWDEMAKICFSIADIYIEKEEFNEAEMFLEEATRIAEEQDIESDRLRILRVYSNLERGRKNYEKALELLDEYIEKNEIYQKKINYEKIGKMEAKYKTEIYRLQNLELKQQTRSKNEQIAKLSDSLEQLRCDYRNLEDKFRKSIEDISAKDDALTNQESMVKMGKMLSQIAHQWKQPLNVIGVLVQSIQEAWDFEELTDEYLEKQIKIILKQINYMSATINDFRDFFKPVSDKVFLVKDAVQKAIHLTSYGKDNGLVSFESEEGIKLWGNPNDLMQAVMNIINNAREAMEERDLDNPEIRIKVISEDENAFLRIYNKGSNITEQQQKKIFEPYYTSRGEKGTGLGLYICRMIVENKYQGRIYIENKPDGVEFVIEIPLKKQQR